MIRRALMVGLMISALPAAEAAPHRLAPGSWQISEGLALSGNDTPESSRQICIQPGKSIVTPDWFAELAKPGSDCSSALVSETSNGLEFRISCDANGRLLEGPSRVSIEDNLFSIVSDLAMDLGGYPFPLHRALTARRVSSQCEH